MRWLLWFFVLLLALLILLPAAALIGLNTQPGRDFAMREINHLAGPNIQITGLAGHFPADIKLATLAIADANGPWARAQNLELRWKPQALLRRDVDITTLTARTISITRAPASSPSKKSSAPLNLHHFQINIAHLAIPALDISAKLAGEDVALNVTGAASLPNLTEGRITLNATTPDGRAQYHLQGSADPRRIALAASIAEPPAGLIGHFAGPQIHSPLAITVTLNGPRDNAALTAAAALGAARLTASGTLGLNPGNPHADVHLLIPALAPFGALAGQSIGGDTALHIIISHRPQGGSHLQLSAQLALTRAPGHAAPLIGPAATLQLRADVQNNRLNIQALNITAAAFNAAISGMIGQNQFALTTDIAIPNISALTPGLRGNLHEQGSLNGGFKDFALDTDLSGDIEIPGVKSGPFAIALKATHLPAAPTGTITGSGALEGAPLAIQASYAATESGAIKLQIAHAAWRSLTLTADLARAAGEQIPTGSANFSIRNLADFAAFAPIPLAGGLTGDFAHADAQNFKLNLTARNLMTLPSLGPVNATLHANGPVDALSITAKGNLPALYKSPAALSLAGRLNLNARSATLSALTASWHGLDAALLGPAGISTVPGLAIRHLAATLNGARVTLDGTLTPTLAATASITNLPASIAALFVPTLKASGMLAAHAALTGSIQSPAGNISLAAQNLKIAGGPAASLPPINLAATAKLANASAQLTASLTAGRKLSLSATGTAPLSQTGRLALHIAGSTDLRLADPVLAANGTSVRGLLAADLMLTGTPAAPLAMGHVTLANGSVQNIASGLNLTAIAAGISATGHSIELQSLIATAGTGTITGHGQIGLKDPKIPIDLTLNAAHATPISSDLITETLDAALRLTGDLRGNMALGGTVKIDQANINIPKSLPPSVANLPIINENAPLPAAPPPPPEIALNLLITAGNQIFIRGDGLFAELGGRVHVTGTTANPNPEGGFTLIRGNLSLAGKALQFTQGNVSFNGDGFMPTLDLEATTTSADNTSIDTLAVGGTAARPIITLRSTPPLPSDEILAQLLFAQSTASLSPFQAASLAAALAQLAGVGGGLNPLDKVRNALGLDQLSLGGSGSGPPSLQAGRYIAPGVYLGASQATNGQGTQASVEINLYKGLKLQTTTGTSGAGSGTGSSVGLTYQFNY